MLRPSGQERGLAASSLPMDRCRPVFSPRFVHAGLLLSLLGAPACLNIEEGDLNEPAAPSAPSTAQEVLDRYVEALGGEEALRALTQRTVEARVLIVAAEGCEDEDDPLCQEQQGQFLLHSTADGRMYRRMVIGDLVDERGYNGETGWELQPGVPPLLVLDDASQSLASREDALLHWYLDFTKRGIMPAIESARSVDIDGNPAELDGVRWAGDDKTPLPPRTYWFDRSTGLLAEEVETEGDVTRTVVYDEYQEVDGTQVPHRIRQITQYGEEKQVVELTVQRTHHDDIRAELFELPEPAAAEPAPDDRLAGLDAARKAHEDDPKSEGAAVAYARSAWLAAHFEEALDAIDKTLKINSKEPEVLWFRARVMLLKGQLKQAEKAFIKAAKVGVRPELIAHELGVVALRAGNYKNAAKWFGESGEAPLQERYGSFEGKPYKTTFSDGCVATVPLVDGFVAPVVKAKVNDEELTLLVDTSVADLVLDPNRAQRLLITTDAQSRLGGADGPPVGHGQADTVELGGFKLDNVPVDIFPAELMAEVSAGRPLDGVIGSRAFMGHQVTFDFPEKSLEVVRGTSRCKSNLAERRQEQGVPFFVHDTHMLFALGKMNGSEGLYLVNSAMRGAGLAATIGAFLRAATAPPVLIRGSQAGAFVEVENFDLGPFAFKGVTGAWGWAEQTAPDEFRVDGMLGLETFEGRAWTIDFMEHRMYFGDEAKPAKPSKSPKSSKPAKK